VGEGSAGPLPLGESRFLIKYALDHPGADGLVSAEKILGKTDYDLSPAFIGRSVPSR